MSTTADEQQFALELLELRARINESIARTAQLQRQTWWYPFVIATGVVGGVATVTTLLLKFLAPGAVG